MLPGSGIATKVAPSVMQKSESDADYLDTVITNGPFHAWTVRGGRKICKLSKL